MRIVVFGAGAVGSTVAGWVAPHHDELFLLARGETARALRERGLSLYPQGHETEEEGVRVQTIEDLSEPGKVDVVLLAVKNYSLETSARQVREALGDRPIVVGLQNGVENQKILPGFFSKVIYGVVGYNAWADRPGRVGFQKRGPLLLGTPDDSLGPEMEAIARILGLGVPTRLVSSLQEAVHTKLVLNLTNSFTTLIGHTFREVTSLDLVQHILSTLIYEGVGVVKAAGFREHKIPGLPSWTLIRLSATLPQWLTRGLFRRNLAKMVISSMAQDVILKGRPDTELDSINGYLVHLADEHHVSAPVNRALYAICAREFARPGFEPMDVAELWRQIQAYGQESP